MVARGENRTAAAAAVVAVLLWQVTTEVRALAGGVGMDRAVFSLWPQGSPLSLQILVRGRAGLTGGLAILVGLAVLYVVVHLIVRTAVRRGSPSRGTVFLAAWMAVVLGGFVASLVALPLALLAQFYPLDYWWQQYYFLTGAPYWGIVIGWIAALAASARWRSGLPAGPAYPAAGTYPGAPGYAAGPVGAPQAEDVGGDSDGQGSPSRSPYV